MGFCKEGGIGLQAWVEHQEQNRVRIADRGDTGSGDGGQTRNSFFRPGKPPQVQAIAEALRVHRGNVDDLWMQLRSLCHGLEDSLESFAEEACGAGRRVGGMLDVILEAELDDRIDPVVCSCGDVDGTIREAFFVAGL